MSEETIQEQVIARAIKDPAFWQDMLTTPGCAGAGVRHPSPRTHRRARAEEPPNIFTLCCLPGTSGRILPNE